MHKLQVLQQHSYSGNSSSSALLTCMYLAGTMHDYRRLSIRRDNCQHSRLLRCHAGSNRFMSQGTFRWAVGWLTAGHYGHASQWCSLLVTIHDMWVISQYVYGCRHHELNPINIRVGTGIDGQPLTAQLQATVPLGKIVFRSSARSVSNALYCWYIPTAIAKEFCKGSGSWPLGREACCPLVILSAGFLLDGSQYRSYCQDLATWGYVSVIYDCSELLDDRQTVIALRYVGRAG